MKSSKTLVLDVREDLKNGREPFGTIMKAFAALTPDQDLLLVAPFEPLPLYGVLGQQGFGHEASGRPDGGFEVRFSRSLTNQARNGSEAPVELPSTRQACTGTPFLDLDARGLEPPQPLVRILEAVSNLPRGVSLRAQTDRRPIHLYPHLEERGLAAESVEQADGSFITYVRAR